MRGRFATVVGVALIAWGAAAAAAAEAATTRFVAVAARGGNDNGGTNTCVSAATPCLTITHAISVAAGGDTIQMGPGRFPEAVDASTKKLTFVGSGAGTSTAFNPATQTLVDAIGTGNPGFSTGNHPTTFQNMRIRGGLTASMEVEPAIQSAGGASVPPLTITGCVLLQASPANPAGVQPAVEFGPSGASLTIASSTVVAFNTGVATHATGGSVSISGSQILTPAPPVIILPLGEAGVFADVPLTITNSTVVGVVGITDEGTTTTIARTVIRASGDGVYVSDTGQGPVVAMRDSVIEPDAGILFHALAVGAPHPNETKVPTVDLTFDTLLARDQPAAHTIDVTSAATGTHVSTDNTILRAVDTSGGSGADEIATGAQAINWNLAFTAYTETSGPGVPPPGSGTNINAVPGFVSESTSDLHLSPASTLFDRGDPSAVQAGETDVEGALRSVAHACGALPVPDLGAYEAAAPGCPPPTVSITSPANGATFTQGQTVLAGYSCAVPAPALISACAGLVASGKPIDTSTPGVHSFTVAAIANDGATATATDTYTVKPPTPALGSIREAHKTWREGRSLAKLATAGRASAKHKTKPKPPVGTTFTFTLNTPATLKLAFAEHVGGRLVRHKCVAQTKHNKHDHACTRSVSAGSLTLAGHAGTDKITFQGRLSSKHKLASGTYTLTLTATNATGQSRSRTTTFTIAKG
jgi:hypothetical protein